jgi:hypothetical protein
MIYLARHFGLSLKASYEFLIAYKLRGENFNRRQAIYLHVLSFVNSAHASLPYLFKKAITPRNHAPYHRIRRRLFSSHYRLSYRRGLMLAYVFQVLPIARAEARIVIILLAALYASFH